MSGKKVLVQPINVIFKNLQQRQKISIWLYDNVEMRIEGRIIGFDEFMNVVIDEAEEVYVEKTKDRRPLGRILLKGDAITLIQQLQ
ncbi:Sm-like ribonucleo protein [Exidia glandulosa HHB12029]|uniref:Small nuclear ribonucleoprotein E n=1 Tax=Exidia glandulosa HHB12029 TaxID=1314781 RepID=A0A166MAT7_EXIGL|nr:Sm-like ribonucleo protein [Exidia glandulosa HHB12029]